MIKTTKQINYASANEAPKLAIIELAVNSKMTPNLVMYDVKHYAILDEARVEIKTTSRTLSIEDYNQLSGAVDLAMVNVDTTELTPFEIEQLRLKLGLFIYVTQVDFMEDSVHVAYNLLPNEWGLS